MRNLIRLTEFMTGLLVLVDPCDIRMCLPIGACHVGEHEHGGFTLLRLEGGFVVGVRETSESIYGVMELVGVVRGPNQDSEEG